MVEKTKDFECKICERTNRLEKAFQAYLSQPSVMNHQLVFVADDDIWKVDREGGLAVRLTASKGLVQHPKLSPDGKWIAYLGQDAGSMDVYLISSLGGEPQRLTYFGVEKIIRWKNTGTLIVGSCFECRSPKESLLYEVDIKTGAHESLPWGPASDICYGPQGTLILGRHCGDPARWKRYTGGTAGVLWVRRPQRPHFSRILMGIKTNISSPHIIGQKVYFITDFEGHGNIYESDLEGKDLKRLTHHNEYYCRNLETDGKSLVYQAGGDIFTYDLKKQENRKVSISCPTPGTQALSRFVSASRYLDDFSMSPDLQNLAVIARGQAFLMAPFRGAVTNLDRIPDVRFAYPSFSHCSRFLLYSGISSIHDEHLLLFDKIKQTSKHILPKKDWGKIHGIVTNPKKDLAVVINNRLEMWLVDYINESVFLIERSTDSFGGLDWSPCGNFLAYSSSIDKRKWGIKIFDIKTRKTRLLMEPVLTDLQVSFDPQGKYLYMTSVRELGPVYNETHFDLGFPAALRPYVVVLSKTTSSPFEVPFESYHLESAQNLKKNRRRPERAKQKSEVLTEIDFEGIEHRVLPLPVDFGGYGRIAGIPGGLIYTRKAVKPLFNESDLHQNLEDLFVYRFDKDKEELFHQDVEGFVASPRGGHVLFRYRNDLRFVSTHELPSNGENVGRTDGWVDLRRIRLHIEPKQEWKQMYREAWLLQKEHFWRSDMSKIDWNYVYRKYWPLLDRIKTRSELSDLLWEMQGELGTSHAYEWGGDYHRRPAPSPTGYLGAQFAYLPKKKSFVVSKIFRGESFICDSDSPLLKPGVSMSEGDRILAVDAHGFSGPNDLWKALEHKAGVQIELSIQRQGKKQIEKVTVEPLWSQSLVLYREWVETNKKFVHKVSKGRLGYVHIPDMGPNGYAEFYRNFISEQVREGLIVDVRYNGGGHVSQHILKVLAQKPLGLDVSRYHGQIYYPTYAVRGPIVALTNEKAGSDGDIFSHSFKLMKIGPLIGKRTWGGVIGIAPRTYLRDHSLTTQPEFSSYFKDVGWRLENHGTEPDIEIDVSPDDYARGADPQLNIALEVALDAMKINPPFFIDIKEFPDLRPRKKILEN